MRRRISKRKILFAAVLLVLFLGVAYYFRHTIRSNGARLYQILSCGENRYQAEIDAAAARHGVDSRLICAVIKKESGFNPKASGGAGEVGLMQIRPTTAATDWALAHGLTVPVNGLLYDPALNIEIGTWYLAGAIQRWRKYNYALELALCHYNAGETRAREWQPATTDGEMKTITITSTRQYVKDILKEYRKQLKK